MLGTNTPVVPGFVPQPAPSELELAHHDLDVPALQARHGLDAPAPRGLKPGHEPEPGRELELTDDDDGYNGCADADLFEPLRLRGGCGDDKGGDKYMPDMPWTTATPAGAPAPNLLEPSDVPRLAEQVPLRLRGRTSNDALREEERQRCEEGSSWAEQGSAPLPPCYYDETDEEGDLPPVPVTAVLDETDYPPLPAAAAPTAWSIAWRGGVREPGPSANAAHLSLTRKNDLVRTPQT